ncbi:DNA cytosine methyltransferase [Sphingomonas sp. RHCKR47]|uniref:DNA cytosine methyltransferase n=1 Tax=Sphingomonas citricola TaxID=2862498 RepID=UPI001C6806C9|nr:DNA cytosine methyltransferase [Sphingomonas citricola]MBW6524598.1 DNA cytosine methyltransferase [Sphingomonas citricola]
MTITPEPADGEPPAPPRFIAVDFFCGAGGTTRGLIDAGGYVLAGVDKEARCKRTYVENNTNLRGDRKAPEFLQRDIFLKCEAYPEGEQEELARELSDLIQKAQEQFPGAPLLFAICAPCQPFTTLSSRKKMSGDRIEKRGRDSNLLRAALTFVEKHRPDFVLSENVAGIQDERFGGIWGDFRERLNQLGFVTGSETVCVSKFGVAQRRKRSILLAADRDRVRKDRLTEDLVASELIVPKKDENAEPLTVQEAIEHLPRLEAGDNDPSVANHRTRSLTEINIKRISSAKPGETNRYLDATEHGDLSLDCHRRVNAKLKTRGFNDVYTRMRPDGPSPTITTRCHSISNGRFGHYDTTQNRGISLREAAALQSFPDGYVFHPVEMIEPVARMIGNAVPPRLAQFFATYLVESVET